MPNRLIGVYPERITVPGSGLAGYQLHVWENRTTTQAALVNGEGASIAQPVFSDAAGIFEAHPYADGGLYTVAILDPNGVMLAGFPKHDCPAVGGDFGAAAGIPFEPTDLVPATDVQAAIAIVSQLANSQAGLVQRALAPWPTSGTGNAYTITPTPALSAYAAGTVLMIQPDRANTNAATLNANGIGARQIRKMSLVTPGTTLLLDAGDLRPGRAYLVVDDGTRFVVLFPALPTVVTNANGTAIYRADGSLECRTRLSNIDVSIASPINAPYPAAFSTRPTRSLLALDRNTAFTSPSQIELMGKLVLQTTGTGWSLHYPTTSGLPLTTDMTLVAYGEPA